ncbi:MAG: hypothetical protein WC480_00790 [Patescibacteria group bacterium]
MNRILSKIFFLVVAISLLVPVWAGQAAETPKPVDIYFFYGDGCPHCATEEQFLDQLKKDFGDRIFIHYYEVWHDRDNAKLLAEVAKLHPIAVAGVPITLIGDQHIIGYQDDATTGQEILGLISQCQAGQIGECPAKNLLNQHDNGSQLAVPAAQGLDKPVLLKIPFVGTKDLSYFSLPLLAVVIGLLDGFNPCAMWVLVFLISLLLGVDSQRRRWLIGGIFIIASGAVYFLFMTAWLQAFLFLGYLWYIRFGIGLFAVLFGIYNLRDYWRTRKIGPVCKVTSSEKRRKIFDRIKGVIMEKNLLLALAGIALLAFSVNIVELACSAGFPAIFTSLLAINNISRWEQYLYILVYVLFFMFDDLIIFVAAMVTLHVTNIGTKYTKYSNLIGGAVILLLGLLLIFKPAWLSFG